MPRRRPMAVRHFSFLAISLRRRPMAVRRSRRRARGSMATAPGLNERPVLRWWCRSFPDSRISLAAHGALKDQQKMAPVYHTCWELTLPLTRSLCDFETKVFIRWRASVARPILFLFSDFLFSDLIMPRRRPMAVRHFSFLAISLRRRPMAVRRSRRRARGSMATAPGLNERPVLRWWCRSFPDFRIRWPPTGH